MESRDMDPLPLPQLRRNRRKSRGLGPGACPPPPNLRPTPPSKSGWEPTRFGRGPLATPHLVPGLGVQFTLQIRPCLDQTRILPLYVCWCNDMCGNQSVCGHAWPCHHPTCLQSILHISCDGVISLLQPTSQPQVIPCLLTATASDVSKI